MPELEKGFFKQVLQAFISHSMLQIVTLSYKTRLLFNK